MAIERRLGRGQRQRKARRLSKWCAELGQWRLTDCRHHGGKDLDFARWRSEPGIAVFLIGGFERHPDAAWAGPQCLEAEPAGRKMVVERRRDIAIPELIAKAQAHGK